MREEVIKTEEKVVSLNDYKKNLSINDSKIEYKRYLKLLKTNELEDEVQNVLDENLPEGLNLSIIDKSQMILSEIADRSAPNISNYIKKMKDKLDH